jgi:hypothetical protein
VSITRRTVRPGKADFEAVRTALLRLGISEEFASSDEFTDGEGQSTESRDIARRVRRALVDELLDVRDARQDLIDLQVQNGLNPLELLTKRRLGLDHRRGPVT